jgi:hypothetical protein
MCLDEKKITILIEEFTKVLGKLELWSTHNRFKILMQLKNHKMFDRVQLNIRVIEPVYSGICIRKYKEKAKVLENEFASKQQGSKVGQRQSQPKGRE